MSEARAPWRAVAVPSEHGGWGLTLEPVLLGLLVGFSGAGLLIAALALLTFLVRTPLKLALVDRFRHRRLPRTRLAERVAVVELTLMALGYWALMAVEPGERWWWPVAAALPLVVVELWFDARSRSRRLVPELAGGVGIAAVAPAIVLADHHSLGLAGALWLILVARAAASIPFVRAQIFRARRGIGSERTAQNGHTVGLVAAAVAVALDHRALAGALAVTVAVLLHNVWLRRPVPAIKIVGLQQLGVGLSVAITTGLGAVLL